MARFLAIEESKDAIERLVASIQHLLDSDHGPVHEIVQKALFTAAFDHTGGNQVRTAIRLGVTRNILRFQLKQFGLIGSPQSSGEM